MAKRKNKKQKMINIIIIIITLIIALILGIVLTNKYYTKGDLFNEIQDIKESDKTDEELTKLNYSNDDIKTIKKELSSDNINYLINNKIDNKTAMTIINETYYIDNYLKKYIDLYNKNKNEKTDKIIALVNSHVDDGFYKNTERTDDKAGKFIILNKHYYTDNKYQGNDLITLDPKYSLYGSTYTIELSKECYEAFLKLYNAANAAGAGFKINSAYRSFEKQETLYNKYKSNDGEEKADTYSARPGYSEHQTGYAFDIRDYPFTTDDYSKTKSFTWVSEHAHEYGFIIRFPKDKEDITGYQYESWHYRYCGIECATYIHNHNITFEEYYEYFIRFNNPRNLK